MVKRQRLRGSSYGCGEWICGFAGTGLNRGDQRQWTAVSGERESVAAISEANAVAEQWWRNNGGFWSMMERQQLTKCDRVRRCSRCSDGGADPAAAEHFVGGQFAL
ncbi:hypothetical protein Salat_0187200 [Sesamum alatum]|uniref:Uncharacterized protein n=1 Tax=Sesamum alatum TaxID=300844 RepID=A0AAE2CXV8_9LAMI|nr:hypothetical protein Salat_0187200 [Sesamum alatum]